MQTISHENAIFQVNEKKRNMVAECIDVAKANQGIRRLIIFGSSVTDHCRDDSDVDICLDINCDIHDLNLYDSASKMTELCDFNCDLLIYSKINGEIKEEIDRKGVTVYELA